MRDRLWRIRQTPQKFHYLDWCEKIKEKYSSREEYGFAGATLTFLQGEKESEQKKSGEERRLMLFFQNLIFCWQNSIGVKISIGNARILEENVRTALELSMKNLSMEEEKRFSREVKIARDLLAGKGRTEAEMRESPVFCRWQDGFSWEEISGIREIREYANGQPEKDIGDPPGDCTDQEHGTYRTFGRTAGKCGEGCRKKYRKKYGKKYRKKYGNSFRQKYSRTPGEPHGVSGTGRKKKRFCNGIQGNHGGQKKY